MANLNLDSDSVTAPGGPLLTAGRRLRLSNSGPKFKKDFHIRVTTIANLNSQYCNDSDGPWRFRRRVRCRLDTAGLGNNPSTFPIEKLRRTLTSDCLFVSDEKFLGAITMR